MTPKKFIGVYAISITIYEESIIWDCFMRFSE